MWVDSGAIGKGLSMQIDLKLLHRAGIQQAYINFGDSSVFGVQPHDDCWPVNINLCFTIAIPVTGKLFTESFLENRQAD